MAVIRAFVIVLLFGSICEAYGDATHGNVVRDAFEFIIANKGDTTTKYPGGATPKSDYDLLLRTLSIVPGPTADVDLRRIAGELGRESVRTDRLPDVTLNLPWGFGERTAIAGISFTLFSHFIDVRLPSVFWEHDGYSYERARQNAQCSGSAEDLLGNFLIDHSGATLNTVRSTPYVAYREPRQARITVADYEKHFQQDIGRIRFWPITALATFWFESFLKSPKSLSGAPLNLVHIGPALHAAADTTQPFHAVGMSGCGHMLYEDMVDTLYLQQPNRVYDPLLVKSLLAKTSHLNSRISIVDMLTRNAEYAADEKFCKCTTISCDCSSMVTNHASAKELANLAIAASVLVLRKGFTEWSPGMSSPRVLTAPAEPRRVLRLRRFSDIDISPSLASAKPDFGPVSKVLAGSVNALKEVTTQIEPLSAADFTGRLNGAIAGLASATAKGAEKWDPFKIQVTVQVSVLRGGTPARVGGAGRGGEQSPVTTIQDPWIAFSLPTANELDSPAQWNAYLRSRNNFHVAHSIFRTAVLIAWLEGNLEAGRIAESQVQATDQYAKALRERQAALIQAYQR